jgi:hypothetical protein
MDAGLSAALGLDFGAEEGEALEEGTDVPVRADDGEPEDAGSAEGDRSAPAPEDAAQRGSAAAQPKARERCDEPMAQAMVQNGADGPQRVARQAQSVDRTGSQRESDGLSEKAAGSADASSTVDPSTSGAPNAPNAPNALVAADAAAIPPADPAAGDAAVATVAKVPSAAGDVSPASGELAAGGGADAPHAPHAPAGADASAGAGATATGAAASKSSSAFPGASGASGDARADASPDAANDGASEASPGGAASADPSASDEGHGGHGGSDRSQDGGSHAATPRGGAVDFAEPVDERLVPVTPDEPPEQRAGRLAFARAQLAQDKAHAVAKLSGFRETQGQRIAALALVPSQLDRALIVAEQRAVAQIGHAELAQVQAVRAEVARAIGQAQSAATAARAQIQASFTTASTAISAATTAARTQLITSHQAALNATRSAETTQLGEVSRLYTQAESAFRTAAASAGSHAVSVAAGRAGTYRAAKIHRDDSFLDGALTDNRCEARAEAAEKVGQGYRDELGVEGDKQAARMRERKPTDEAAVRQVAEEARRNLDTAHRESLRSLEDGAKNALAAATKTRAGALAGTTRTLQDTLAALHRHEHAKVAAIKQQASGQKTRLRQQRQQVSEKLRGTVTKAVAELTTGLDQSIGAIRTAEVPDPAALDQTLGEAGQAITAQLAQLQGGLEQAQKQTAQALAQGGGQGAQSITQLGHTATAAARQTGSGAAQAIAQGAQSAGTSLQQMSAAHQRAATQLAGAGTRGDTQITAGLRQAYTQLGGNLQDGMQRNADAVRIGLTEVVDHDMGRTITSEANEAASQVQPRWKSVLKWVIIIAIVLVVAIVLGPMVIGAITGLAAGLGASAAVAGTVGAVVGGAIVGAGTAAVTTVVDNAFAGRTGWDLFHGVGAAMAWGALGGALGGGASALLAGPMQGMTALARYGVQVGVDTVINTGLGAAQGNLTWESFGSGLLMSMLVNGVTARPRVRLASEGAMSRGYGAGFEPGVGLRSRVTGATPPGPTSMTPGRMDHVAKGDDVGGGANAGKWNVRGGGHVLDEIIPRADGDGVPHRTRTTDPVTGVSIENFDRWAPSTQTKDKSLFPRGTTRPQVEVMGTEGLNRALTGAPGTSLTPPMPNQTNGSFTATVMGPHGHPIEIAGHYAPTASGGYEVQSVYPNSDLVAATIPVAGGTGLGGSRTLPIPTYSHPAGTGQTDQEKH